MVEMFRGYSIVKKNGEYAVYEVEGGQIFSGPVLLQAYSKLELMDLLNDIRHDLELDNSVSDYYNLEEDDEFDFELDPETPVDEAFR